MTSKNYEFYAAIEAVPDKGGAYVRFPHDIKKEFGKGRLKAQIPSTASHTAGAS